MPNTIQESLKTQFQFSATENNTATPLSILPTTNTALKQSLQAKYPTAVISSYLEIKMLELRVKLRSIAEYPLPASVLSGTAAPVEQNRDLVQSLWTNARKQLNIYHKLGSSPNRLRGSLSLLNKGDVYDYYLEDFLSVLTTESAYPVTSGEDILISLFDAGYGLLQADDELLFTANFTHYLTVTNDSFLNVSGQVIELATFSQSQQILNLLGTGLNIDTSSLATATALADLSTITAKQAKLLDIEADTQELLTKAISIEAKIDALDISGNPNLLLTRNYDALNPSEDLIKLIGTQDNIYTNPANTRIGITASSIETGNVTMLIDRVSNRFHTQNVANSFITFDFALGNATRRICLTGIGIQSADVSGQYYPTRLLIAGSNNGTTFTTINTWSNINFSADFQWRFTSFVNNDWYRYIRLTSNLIDSSGTNYFMLSEVNIYGSTTTS